MYLRESASRAFALLAKNPPLFGQTMIAKASSLRPLPPFPAYCQLGDVIFEIDSRAERAAAAMFFGSYSPLVVNAIKRCLRPGDIFFDVGANVGYLSAVAAQLVGHGGQIHSFEPVPRYFESLQRLVELNPSHTIFANSCAAGASAGSATIHITREPGQNTLVTGYKSGFEVSSTLEVPVITLDTYIESRCLDRVTLIKIDAEGFELPILEGLRRTLRNGHRPPIICEIAPRAYPLMNRNISELSDLMSQFGYTGRDIIDGRTRVHLNSLRHVTDVLFLAGA